jgi:hypothetical protein
MRSRAALILRVGIVSFVALAAMTITSPVVRGAAQHVRWDIISINFPPASPLTILPGGHASALANDGSRITLTGSGTFVAPGGGEGSNGSTTGGGTWQTCNPALTVCVSGTYEVTGLVRWDRAPFPPGGPPPRTDLIDEGEATTGLAVLRIEYSDGDHGILIVSCTGVTADPRLFEGITASKGYVDYWNRVAPVANVDANRTLFHVR